MISTSQMKIWKRIALILPMLILVGCANAEKGFVAKDWSLKMRELGINPIFPPRENFHVGDVFMAPTHPQREPEIIARNGFLPPPVWVFSLSTFKPNLNVLEAFYENRAVFPETTTASGSFPNQRAGDGAHIVPQSRLATGSIFTPSSDLSRLRVVGFPSFMSASISQGGLSALIPVEAFNFLLGASFSNVESASISVPIAETAAVPASALYEELVNSDGSFDYCNKSVTGGKKYMLSMLNALRPVAQTPPKGDDDNSIFAFVPTEVFYARAVDVRILFSKSQGGAVGATLPVPAATSLGKQAADAQSAGKSAPKPEISATTQPVNNAGDVGSRASAINRLADANSQLQSQLARTTPGASVSLLSVAEGAISMRRTYVRPLAIGYRGIQFEIGRSDCMVKGASPVNTSTPLNAPKFLSQILG